MSQTSNNNHVPQMLFRCPDCGCLSYSTDGRMPIAEGSFSDGGMYNIVWGDQCNKCLMGKWIKEYKEKEAEKDGKEIIIDFDLRIKRDNNNKLFNYYPAIKK